MTAIAPITSHTKTWRYWRVQSADFCFRSLTWMTIWPGSGRPAIVFQG